MKKLLILWSIILGSVNLSASNVLFDQANKAYQAGDYMKAQELYDSIEKSGLESAELYYNLGNAHYQNGALAKAILNYEKALIRAPHDEDIQHNLKLAQSKRVDRFEAMPENLFKAFRMGTLRLFSPDNWARLSLAFLALAVVGLALYLFSAYGRMGFISLLGGFILSLFSLVMAFSHQQFQKEHPQMIVMSDSAYVKSGPGEDAEDLFILHAGTKVDQVDQFETWVKLRLIDGKIGWLPQEDLETIN